MSELNYKELQEKGVFDVPYRAFEYMQSQQAEINKLQNDLIKAAEGQMKLLEHNNELQKRIDELENHVSINYDCERNDDQHSFWSGYNQAMRELNDILEGEQND